MKKKTQYKIFDNFLDQKTFLMIQELVMSPELPFFYNAILNYEQGDDYEKHKYDYYFTHLAYKNDRDNLVKGGRQSVYLENFMPIVEKLSVSSLLRIKVNFYPRTEEMKIHAAHTDYPFDHNGAQTEFWFLMVVLYIHQLLAQMHKVDLMLILITFNYSPG